jgi:hypothetical protein
VKALALILLILTAFSQAAPAAANTYVQCRGRNHIVTFRQWSTSLTYRDASGASKTVRVILSAPADLAPRKDMKY